MPSNWNLLFLGSFATNLFVVATSPKHLSVHQVEEHWRPKCNIIKWRSSGRGSGEKNATFMGFWRYIARGISWPVVQKTRWNTREFAIWCARSWLLLKKTSRIGTRGRRIARLVQWHGYESYGEIKDWHFMSSCKRSNKRWLLKCPS